MLFGGISVRLLAKYGSNMGMDRPRWPRRWHNTAQVGSIWPPACLQEAPRRVPGWLQAAPELPKDAPEMPKSLQHPKSFNVLCFSRCRFRWACEISRWLQHRPKEPQDGAQKKSKTAPRASESAPRAHKEGSKSRSVGLRREGPAVVPLPF